VTALVTSLVATAILVGIAIWYGKRREPGRPLTWGEAFVAALFMFGIFVMIYGIVPNQWLQFADKDLKWRSDKIGIPTGPIKATFHWGPFQMKGHLLWPNGIPLANGHFIITAQVMRDVIASLFYIVFGLAHIFAWKWWQARGKAKAAPAELESSAYGRPLVRST